MERAMMRKRITRLVVSLGCVAALAACTVVNTAVIPPGSGPLITSGDTTRPYQSLGLVQTTRKGVLLFGFIDVVGTDLQAGFTEVLAPIVRQMGGDAAINVRFHQTQYLPLTQVLFAFPFFFIPLPTNVTITAEVIRFTDGGGAAPAGGPPPPAAAPPVAAPPQ
jgi:hypothetical protein